MRKEIDYPFRLTAVRSVHDYRWDPDFRFDGESHDFWEMVYADSGQAEAVEEEKVYLLHPGELVCHAPGEFHRIRAAGGTSPRVLIMSFEHTGTVPPELGNGVFALTPDESEEYGDVFRKMKNWWDADGAAADRGGADGAEAALGLTCFILALCRSHAPQNRTGSSGRAEEYRRVIEVMAAGVRENLTLDDTARRAAVGKSKIKTLFAEYSGISPKKYYDMLRAREALRCLRDGMSVTETAEYMNFSSPNYLSLFFRRYYGTSPRDAKTEK